FGYSPATHSLHPMRPSRSRTSSSRMRRISWTPDEIAKGSRSGSRISRRVTQSSMRALGGGDDIVKGSGSGIAGEPGDAAALVKMVHEGSAGGRSPLHGLVGVGGFQALDVGRDFDALGPGRDFGALAPGRDFGVL